MRLVKCEVMPDGMPDHDPNETPIETSVLPGQYSIYKPFRPKEQFEPKAKLAWAFAMMGIIILPLGLIAAYLGADALAGMNRTGNQKGRNDAMVGLVLGVIEVVAMVAVCIWYSETHSFIRLLNR
jgi:F0F1-type ATP synthase membrane subunit c/vacuolar-type H+-ATPase subunit K